MNANAENDPRDSASRFGVLDFLAWSDHYDDAKVDRAVVLMKEAGIGYIRLDFLWSDIEPERGRFDFSRHDRLVEKLDRSGIKILGLLGYNAPWASKSWNQAPDPKLFTAYARVVAARYKRKIKYWEIWNEPDVPTYWQPQDDLKSYALLLKETYPALKKEDPTCVVLMGGVSKSIAVSLKRLYRYGVKDFFDVVNIHPFADPLLPDALGQVRGNCKGVLKIMQANGDGGKPIWITEIGCPGVKPPGSGWWIGKSPDEKQQAEWVSRIYGQAFDWPNVEKVFWAFFRDTPNHFKNDVDYFGLVRQDFSRKPAYEAYKKIANAN